MEKLVIGVTIVLAIVVVGYLILSMLPTGTTGSGSPTMQKTSQPVGNPDEFPILAMS